MAQIKIALAGNPNCGKTTMFNALTGASQYVGNWPGVTVEKKEGKLRGYKDVIVTDLPGIYSLSPYTLEEVVSRNYLLNEKPDVIINLVDGSNIERNLYLTTQILELGLPVLIALNMMDVVKKRGAQINVEKLSKELGCPIVETAAVTGEGLDEMAKKAVELASSHQAAPAPKGFIKEIESALTEISAAIEGKVTVPSALRWYTVKVFERDEKVLADLGYGESLPEELESVIARVEENLDDDAESIITGQRYDAIGRIVGKTVRKKESGLTMSDKIDRVVTNRVLALPIFALVICFIYYVSVSTVGSWWTDWANDQFLGEDGWFLFGIGRSDYDDAADEFSEAEQIINGADYYDADVGDMLHSDGYLDQAIAAGYTFDGESDDVEALEALAAEIEADGGLTVSVDIWDLEEMEIVDPLSVTVEDFLAAAEVEEPDPADYSPVYIPGIYTLLQTGLEAINCNEVLQALILDGIWAGVGAVLGFVPQMLVLFFFMAILEDCGYMARIAFIMDRIFRRFGLSGKSFIPMLIGTGCGIPGVMATRTIENESDRKMSIMTTTFMPCGAKLPIIALIAGALFNDAWWVGPSCYFLGIAAVLFTGIVMKKTKAFAGDPAPFVMELPAYHMPRPKGVLIHMWDRAKSFIKKAGTIILLASALVWFLSSFGFENGFGMVEDMDNSLLAVVGGVFSFLFVPLGFGDWKATAAVVTGLIAKENVVGTFGVLYAGLEEVSESGYETWAILRQTYTAAAAYAFLVFNLLCAPCFAAIGAMKREFGTTKWTLAAVGYQCLLAWCVALVVYQLAGLFTGVCAFGFWTVVAIALVAFGIYLLARPGYKPESERLSRRAAANM
ncbi:MAG: ferrous iron transport protein B [Clostridiales bacterium]|nr:ferrous iron transport protein B [Clostridiales bacterium]